MVPALRFKELQKQRLFPSSRSKTLTAYDRSREEVHDHVHVLLNGCHVHNREQSFQQPSRDRLHAILV